MDTIAITNSEQNRIAELLGPESGGPVSALELGKFQAALLERLGLVPIFIPPVLFRSDYHGPYDKVVVRPVRDQDGVTIRLTPGTRKGYWLAVETRRFYPCAALSGSHDHGRSDPLLEALERPFGDRYAGLRPVTRDGKRVDGGGACVLTHLLPEIRHALQSLFPPERVVLPNLAEWEHCQNAFLYSGGNGAPEWICEEGSDASLSVAWDAHEGRFVLRNMDASRPMENAKRPAFRLAIRLTEP